MVGVRQGATGQGPRPRATPFKDNASFSNRMSNLQTLIGNSFKYLLPRVPLSVGLLFEIHAWWWAAMITVTC